MGRTRYRRLFQSLAGELFSLLVVTAVAALLRSWAIGTLPPGLYRDEAYNGLDALRVLQGHRPLFFEANNGREPLYIYMLAASVAAWGRSPGALRLVSALVGIVSVPAFYWLGRVLFDRTVATVSGFLAAVTIWTLNLSRVAFRVGTMLPLMALALTFLWRGLRHRRRKAMTLAGVCYGLTFYTYLAARFSVIFLLFFVIYSALWHRDLLWTQGWLLFGALAIVVAAPLGIYFLSHWRDTLLRAGQVSIFDPDISGGDPWGTLLRHVGRTALGFVYRGDFIPRHNVPLRAVFNPFVGLAFVAGVGLAVARARREPACGLILIWLITMSLPTILAEDAPHMLRGAGVLPVLFLFPALAFAEVLRLLKGHWTSLTCILLGLGLILGGVRDVKAYWRHLHSEAVYYNFEAGATELAVEANRFLGKGWQGKGLAVRGAAAIPGRQVGMAARLWRDWPSLRYLCPQGEGFDLIDNQDAGDKVFSSPDVKLFLWPYEDNEDILAALPRECLLTVEEGAWERGDLESDSRLLYVTIRSHPAQGVPRNAGAAWEQGVRLLGYRTQELDDARLRLTLYWRADASVDTNYSVFCHVLRDGVLLGQHDGPAAEGYYSTDMWRPGDIVEDRRVIPLSALYAEETDEIVVGLYDWRTMEHLALLNEVGQVTGETEFRLP
ncbi:MAG: glycosyltransferase family 39 protein [Chloroflexota bacterium]|nr:glycosyltransferase family 39 protein [Chloroflexota bacterium]